MINKIYQSKYLLTKMKIELFKFLEKYLRTLISFSFEKKRKNYLFFFFPNAICLILKEYELLSKQGNLISELKENFFRLLKIYLENYRKMLARDITNVSCKDDENDNSSKENPYSAIKYSIKYIFDNVEKTN